MCLEVRMLHSLEVELFVWFEIAWDGQLFKIELVWEWKKGIFLCLVLNKLEYVFLLMIDAFCPFYYLIFEIGAEFYWLV